MRKINYFLLWALVAVSVFTACTKTNDPKPSGKYTNGILIANEGNFLQGNGSLSFWSNDDNQVYNEVYKAENEVGIGGIIQTAKKYNDKLYIVTNVSDQVVVANAHTLKYEATITAEDMVTPFDFAAVGNKGYVTFWGATSDYVNYPKAGIMVIDLSTNKIEKTITLGTRPMGILAYQNKIYVANEGGNKITIINTQTNEAESNIDLTSTPAPSKLIVDKNNKIWAICSNNDYSGNGFLVKINPSNNTIEQTLENIPVSGYNEKVAYYGNYIYFTPQDANIYRIDITNPVAPATAFIEAPFKVYGLGVNPSNGYVFAGESKFDGSGSVKVYNKEGVADNTFTASIAPNGFAF